LLGGLPYRVCNADGSSFFTGLPLAPIEPEGLPVRDGIAAGAEWATTIYAYSPGATPEREIVIDATYEAVGGKPMATRATVACPVVLPIAARCGFFSSSFASAADSAGSATLVADEVFSARLSDAVESLACTYTLLGMGPGVFCASRGSIHVPVPDSSAVYHT